MMRVCLIVKNVLLLALFPTAPGDGDGDSEPVGSVPGLSLY